MKLTRIVLASFLYLILCTNVSAETITDNALWTGALFLWENDRSFDYSAEYQVRLDENMTALSNHFLHPGQVPLSRTCWYPAFG